jgi:hypothetical protein
MYCPSEKNRGPPHTSIDLFYYTTCLSLFSTVHFIGKFIVRGVSHSHSKCMSDRLVYTGKKVSLTLLSLLPFYLLFSSSSLCSFSIHVILCFCSSCACCTYALFSVSTLSPSSASPPLSPYLPLLLIRDVLSTWRPSTVLVLYCTFSINVIHLLLYVPPLLMSYLSSFSLYIHVLPLNIWLYSSLLMSFLCLCSPLLIPILFSSSFSAHILLLQLLFYSCPHLAHVHYSIYSVPFSVTVLPPSPPVNSLFMSFLCSRV